jgi:hypothetical protein
MTFLTNQLKKDDGFYIVAAGNFTALRRGARDEREDRDGIEQRV